jgi:hypothetical protein
MLKSLLTCDTQAWLRSNGWSTQVHEEKYLRAGSDAAAAFQGWRLGENVNQAVERFRSIYKPYSDKYLLDDDAYHVDNLSKILSVYFAANPIIAQPFETVATEEEFCYTIAETPTTEYVVTDRSDGIVRWKSTGDLYCAEDKTKGRINNEAPLIDFIRDSQIISHVAAARAAGYPVKGVLLNLVQFNKLPNPLAVTKTGKPLSCRIAGHGLQKNCWTLHCRWHPLTPLLISDEDINEWKDEVREELLRYESILGLPVRLARQQGLFGHCGRCEFLQFCQSRRSNWDLLVQRERRTDKNITWSGIYQS